MTPTPDTPQEEQRVPTATIIKALYTLADDIQSDDGIAQAALQQAARRMEELDRKCGRPTPDTSPEEIQRLVSELEKGSVIPSRPDRIALARYVRQLERGRDKSKTQAEIAEEKLLAEYEANMTKWMREPEQYRQLIVDGTNRVLAYARQLEAEHRAMRICLQEHRNFQNGSEAIQPPEFAVKTLEAEINRRASNMQRCLFSLTLKP